MESRVHIVTVSPGPADLLSLRAAYLLRRAQLVVYEPEVPVGVLALAGEQAELLALAQPQADAAKSGLAKIADAETARLRVIIETLGRLVNREPAPAALAMKPVVLLLCGGSEEFCRRLRGEMASLAGAGAAIEMLSAASAASGQIDFLGPPPPLAGRRIVVTRTAAAASLLAASLRDLGAEPVEFPTIRIEPPDSYQVLDGALARASEFDWVIFTSAAGVRSFIGRLGALGRDVRALAGACLAAIGPATATELRSHALGVEVVPAVYRAEALIDAIGAARIKGARLLIARAQTAREVLPEQLAALGAREVCVAAAYKTVKAGGAGAARIRTLLERGEIDLVTFTSPSTVANFDELVAPPPQSVKAAVIGPITEARARSLGYTIAATAEAYTAAGLTAAIVACLATPGRSAEPRLCRPTGRAI